MVEYIWLVPLFPFLGFLINGLLGSRLSEKQIGIVGAVTVALSLFTGVLIFLHILGFQETERHFQITIYNWIDTGDFSVGVRLLVDQLSLIMVLVVTGVGLLIHIYSIGYMHGDRSFARYFAFLNLFTFAMLVLVLADNFLLLFVGWEGVGLCSYLLIGFWFENKDYAFAGRKAFIVNRIGDFGFLIATFLLVAHFGTLAFDSIFKTAPDTLPETLATVICLLLFVGAAGKSAQIPLYVWLPDAMAGPTPVSALIHAATMVTAGVYMMARCHVLFLQAPAALAVIAIVGVATALLAATIAIVANDIKKILAYSTISQIGLMVLACGVGAFGAAMFHLTTHAYFKALLFLGAGSVMHALNNETDIQKMGGLRKKLPLTHKVFLVGGLALSGVPFFSGFFSKDEILWKTINSVYGNFWLWCAAGVVSGLTAFYTFRMIFLTFYGRSRLSSRVEESIHESPKIMTVPLSILAVLAVCGGWIGIPHLLNEFEHFIEPIFVQYLLVDLFPQVEGLLSLEIIFMTLSILIATLGIGFAYLLYVARPNLPARISAKFGSIYNFLMRKWYVDEVYDILIVKPLQKLSEIVLWRVLDIKIIDGFVNQLAGAIGAISGRIRRIETGMVQNYALSIMLGVAGIVGYFLFS